MSGRAAVAPRPIVGTPFGLGALIGRRVIEGGIEIACVRLRFAVCFIDAKMVDYVPGIESPSATSGDCKGKSRVNGRKRRGLYVFGRFNLRSVEKVIISRGCWRQYQSALSSRDWNLFWGSVAPFAQSHTCRLDQRIVGFSNHMLANKDELEGQLRRARAALSQDASRAVFLRALRAFDGVPATWVLPAELGAMQTGIQAAVADSSAGSTGSEAPPRPIFIAKPSGLNRGQGIFLFRSFEEFKQKSGHQNGDSGAGGQNAMTHYVVQRYIADPCLVFGHKFDLRLYVLVSSFWPLRTYLYSDGLVRFCSQPYSTKPCDLDNAFRQLTNYSVNKIGGAGCQNGAARTAFDRHVGPGNKWTLRKLKAHIERERGAEVWARAWARTQDLIALVFVSGSRTVPTSTGPFQIFGVDVLLDSALRPWLLETNGFPALHMSTPIDAAVKGPLIHDTFELLGIDDLVTMPPVTRARLPYWVADRVQLSPTVEAPNVTAEAPIVTVEAPNVTAEVQRVTAVSRPMPSAVVSAVLVVTGAGTWLANGEYRSAGRMNGATLFLKADRQFITIICRAEGAETGRVRWWLSRVDEHVGERDADFYTVDVGSCDSANSCPPERGWIVHGKGKHPPPSLQVISLETAPALSTDPLSKRERQKQVRSIMEAATRPRESKCGAFERIFPCSAATREAVKLQAKHQRMDRRKRVFPRIMRDVCLDMMARREAEQGGDQKRVKG